MAKLNLNCEKIDNATVRSCNFVINDIQCGKLSNQPVCEFHYGRQLCISFLNNGEKCNQLSKPDRPFCAYHFKIDRRDYACYHLTDRNPESDHSRAAIIKKQSISHPDFQLEESSELANNKRLRAALECLCRIVFQINHNYPRHSGHKTFEEDLEENFYKSYMIINLEIVPSTKEFRKKLKNV